MYCAEGKSERFGVIEFAVGADVTESFRLAVGRLLRLTGIVSSE